MDRILQPLGIPLAKKAIVRVFHNMQFGADLILKGSIDTNARNALPRQPERGFYKLAALLPWGYVCT